MAQVRVSWVQVIMMMTCMLMGKAGRAAEYEVGGEKGWVVGAVNYTLWASNYTFFVGDFLVFNYLKEFHSVLEVTKESYEMCNTTNPITESHDGKTRLRLGEARSFYFICGIYKHCPLGQKLEVLASNPPPQSDNSNATKAPPHNLKQNSPPPKPLNSSSALARPFCSFYYHTLLIPIMLAFFTL